MTGETRRSEWVVGVNEARMRLDRFLTGRGELGTRSQVQRLIAAGLVRVEGRPVKAGTVLRAGEHVTLDRAIPGAGVSAVEAEAIALEVLYEDGHILVIDKPAGLVVHPAPGHWRGTLVNALLHRWPEKQGDLDPARMGIVHRLDKDTSGVLVVAKDTATLADLGRQFRRREVRKQYLALVWGGVQRAGGVIAEPIGRHPVQRKKMSVRARGREAITRYEVLERFAGFTLLRVHPETGRTHQIRVHLSALGHPIVGDPMYARGRRVRATVAMCRQALHAESISFRHPESGRPIAVSAPLPGDFAQTLASLRASGLTSERPFSSVPHSSSTPPSERLGGVSDRVRS